MDCVEAKELLSAFLDGESSPEESRRVEEHLATCAGCRAARHRMGALDSFLARSETPVSPGFRGKLFSRLEAEDLLPRRRSLFWFSIRWAPLAAVAALGLFLMISREAPRIATNPPESPKAVAQIPATTQGEARVATNPPGETPSAPTPAVPGGVASESPAPGAAAVAVREELTPEEREIVAWLEILEDPDSFVEPDEVDETEILLPAARSQG